MISGIFNLFGLLFKLLFTIIIVIVCLGAFCVLLYQGFVNMPEITIPIVIIFSLGIAIIKGLFGK